MSHKATNWAIQQRGLDPATKLVLWYLADRHNPDFGCFPSQDQLAADAEMSRSTLNEHLLKLEARGLIRRERRHDPVTKRRLPTRYVLAFEDVFSAPASVSKPDPREHENDIHDMPCPDSGHGFSDGHLPDPCPEAVGHGAMSGIRPIPCPEASGHKPVREPVMVGGGSARAREEARIENKHHKLDMTFRERILAAIGVAPISGLTGRGGNALGTMADMAEAQRWLDAGLTEDEVVGVVREVMAGRNAPVPSRFTYFSKAMARLVAAKASGPMPSATHLPAESNEAMLRRVLNLDAKRMH